MAASEPGWPRYVRHEAVSEQMRPKWVCPSFSGFAVKEREGNHADLLFTEGPTGKS